MALNPVYRIYVIKKINIFLVASVLEVKIKRLIIMLF